MNTLNLLLLSNNTQLFSYIFTKKKVFHFHSVKRCSGYTWVSVLAAHEVTEHSKIFTERSVTVPRSGPTQMSTWPSVAGESGRLPSRVLTASPSCPRPSTQEMDWVWLNLPRSFHGMDMGQLFLRWCINTSWGVR